MKNNYLVQAWLVIVLALGFGAALAGVETWLKPRIEANKLAAILQWIPKLVEGADEAASAKVRPVIVTVGQGAARNRYEAYRAMAPDGQQLGWVVRASGKGFTDRIELLIALDARTETIVGLSVLDQKETPGLGNQVEEVGDERHKGFLWQFFHHGPRAGVPLVVTTASPKTEEPGSENRIKAVSGATISSKSVCDIINEALSAELRQTLLFELQPGPASSGLPKE